MTSGIPYKQAKLAEGWDAIVIGFGIGGLTAAVLLGAHAGKRVLVLERHYEAGGFTHTFHCPGYEWDVGLHFIGQMQDESYPVRRAFDHITGGTRALAAHAGCIRPTRHRGPRFRLYHRTRRFPRWHPTVVSGRNRSHRQIPCRVSGVQPPSTIDRGGPLPRTAL